jgi:hypothetical protein
MKSDIKNFKKTLKTKANNNKKNEDQNWSKQQLDDIFDF